MVHYLLSSLLAGSKIAKLKLLQKDYKGIVGHGESFLFGIILVLVFMGLWGVEGKSRASNWRKDI